MNIFINNRYRKIYKNESLFYVIYKNNKINITKYFKKDGVIKKEYNHLIQQKLKKVGGTGDKLVLCLLNVFTWSGYESFPINFDKKFKKLINEKNVMLLLTQEDELQDDDTTESVKAYSKDKSGRFSFITCINTSLQFCRGVIPRNAIIIKDTEFDISIANLHLEGGRFIDLELDDNTFQIYLEIKLALLKEVLKTQPDIILGDFNSVYCNDPILREQMYIAQQAYYNNYINQYPQKPCKWCSIKETKIKKDEKHPLHLFTSHMSDDYGLNLINKCPNSKDKNDKKVLSLKQIIFWNNEPFILLKQSGYKYIEPENITVNKKINPTNSRGENVIDHVWVKESMHERFTFRTEIYDGFGDPVSNLYGLVSDHKPVILTIKKRLDSEMKGLDSEMKGLDSEMKGLDSETKGLDSEMKGLDSEMKGLDSATRKLKRRR
jgi:hypothetical protein